MIYRLVALPVAVLMELVVAGHDDEPSVGRA